MRDLVEAFARAMNTDRLDEDYDHVMRRLELSFRDHVRRVMYEVLDPTNPMSRDDRLTKAIRRAAMGPPGRE